MKKFITIGDRYFEVNKIAREKFSRYGRLENAYKSFSSKKEKAWNYWLEWSYRVKANGFGICGRNSDIFTLACSVEHEGQTYRVYITPSYNYCYPI